MAPRLQQIGLDSAKFPVHCVSNTEYERPLNPVTNGPGLALQPAMNVDATGIPQLKRRIYVISDACLLTALTEDVLSPMQRGIRDHILRESNISHGSKDATVKLVEALTLNVNISVRSLLEGINTAFADHVFDDLRMTEGRHRAGGAQTVTRWDYEKRSTMLCWMLMRSGVEASGNVKNWNKDIVDVIGDDIEASFAALIDEIYKGKRRFFSSITAGYDTTRAALETILGGQASQDFLEAFYHPRLPHQQICQQP